MGRRQDMVRIQDINQIWRIGILILMFRSFWDVRKVLTPGKILGFEFNLHTVGILNTTLILNETLK